MKKRVVLPLLALLLLLAAAWLVGSAALLRGLAGPGFEAVQGSLWHRGLRAERLQGEIQGQPWLIEGLELAPLRWQDGALQTSLRLRRLRLTLPPGDGKPLDAPTLLARLRLPVALRITPLQIDRLEIGDQRIEALSLQRLQFGAGALLAVDGLQLREPRSQISLQAQGRLADDGALQASLSAQREALQLQASSQGSLERLPLTLRLRDARGERLQGELLLAPLQAQPLLALQAQFDDFDPQALHPQAPAGAWKGKLSLQPVAAVPGRLSLQAEARNAAARRLDEKGWPLRELQLRLELEPARWQALAIQQLELELGSATRSAGRLSLQAQQGLPRSGSPLNSRLLLQALQPRELDASWPAARIDGWLALQQTRLDLQEPLNWQLALQAALPDQAGWQASGQGRLQGQRLQLKELLLRQGPGSLRLQGEAERLAQGWRSEGQGRIEQLALKLAPWPQPSLLQGDLRWQLRRDAAGRHLGQLDLQLGDGLRLAGQALQGEAQWRGDAQAQDWSLRLQAAGDNRVAASGRIPAPLRDPAKELGRATAWLPQQADWKLTQLGALQPLWQPWLQQLAGRSEGRWQAGSDGRWPSLQLSAAELRVQRRGEALLRLQQLQAGLQDEIGSLQLQGLAQGEWQLRSLQAGGGRAQAWQLSADATQRRLDVEQRWQLRAASNAPRIAGGDWVWPGLRLQLGREGEASPLLLLEQAELNLRSGAPLALALQGGRLQLGGEPLQLRAASWQQDGPWAIDLQGRPRLAAWLRQLDRANAWAGEASADFTLIAAGQGDQKPRIQLGLTGLQGDLQLDRRPLGLQALALQLRQGADGAAQLNLGLLSTLLGELDARISQSAAGALAGSARARLPRLQALRPWLPAGLQLEGEASLDAQIGGSREQPQLRGQAGLQLQRLQHPGSGFAAQQGLLRAEFSEDRLLLQELRLQGQSVEGGGPGGELSGSGELRWAGQALEADLRLRAAAFRALNRFDRRLVLSGDAQLLLRPRLLRLEGKLAADEGVFEIGRPDAPALDDDVTVQRADAPPPAAATSRWKRELDLQLDLGQRLRVQGRGFASRLTGQLRLSEKDGKPLQATGRIETQGGRYKAYGQTLDLESGVIRFVGSLDNPRLELLAIKPDIEHRVGVSVTGTAQAPRVRLYAEPDLPDNDKLAWLLLGRDPAEISGRDTAILQRAALALLSGEGSNPASELMDKLGLTEFSLSQGEDAATVLRLGARLSNRWSVGYERSLDAATGSWQLVYRLGQRFRLRAQSGLDSAVDLLWLWRYD